MLSSGFSRTKEPIGSRGSRLYPRYSTFSLEESESGRQLTQIVEPPVEPGKPALAIEQHRPHADRERALHVILDRVADHDGVDRRDREPREQGAEDRSCGFVLPWTCEVSTASASSP